MQKGKMQRRASQGTRDHVTAASDRHCSFCRETTNSWLVWYTCSPSSGTLQYTQILCAYHRGMARLSWPTHLVTYQDSFYPRSIVNTKTLAVTVIDFLVLLLVVLYLELAMG